ncbi:hypothetical protein M5K25_009701 [Dendrobium thyrsiflorum]|uniref:Reverse transcriptase zinc-binding domain-containing protein n=1 Tax=Dendrobium thyrsiflorum TaxID=117978 RepID=A0ABD0V7H7_DENTH
MGLRRVSTIRVAADGRWYDRIKAVECPPPNGNPITDFCSKLRHLKSLIKTSDWASSNSVQKYLDNLHKIQANYLDKIAADPMNPTLNANLKSVNTKITEFSSHLASWIIQRAKAKWLSHGEDDLKFLYAKIRARNSKKNSVTNLSSFGTSQQNNIQNIISHFQSIYNPPPLADMNLAQFPIGDTIDYTMASALIQQVTDAEIKKAVFSGSSSSAPGPDGAIIPKTILKTIRKLSSKFLFFGDIGTTHKLHMVSWDKVCLPKSCGGLGLLTPSALQFGFNCSLISRIYNFSTPLSRWLLKRYTSPWRPPPANASKFWRMLCVTASTAKPHFNFRITPLAPIAFFWDHWTSVVGLADSFHASLDAYVGEFINDKQWVLPLDLDPNISNSIKAIPIYEESKYCLLWDNTELGCFGSYVKVFHDNIPTSNWANHLWFKGCSLRYSAFAWFCLIGDLKTAEALKTRNIYIDSICPLCRLDSESSRHLFFECQYSFNIILKLIPQANSLLLRPNAPQFFDWLDDLNCNADMLHLHKLITCCSIYLIWKERNDRRYGGNSKC